MGLVLVGGEVRLHTDFGNQVFLLTVLPASGPQRPPWVLYIRPAAEGKERECDDQT